MTTTSARRTRPAAVAVQADRQVARMPVLLPVVVQHHRAGRRVWHDPVVDPQHVHDGQIVDLGDRLADVASRMPHPANLTITADNSLLVVLAAAGCVVSLILAVVLIPVTVKMSHHSIWSHPHFSGATLAQFFYVAAQAGHFQFRDQLHGLGGSPAPRVVAQSAAGQRGRRRIRVDRQEAAKAARRSAKESLIEVRTRIDKSDIKDPAVPGRPS